VSRTGPSASSRGPMVGRLRAAAGGGALLAACAARLKCVHCGKPTTSHDVQEVRDDDHTTQESASNHDVRSNQEVRTYRNWVECA
jgi:hypothetical protein